MQSTGQGAMQSSQPVHSDSTTVCMYWCAPTIASTGQAGRQRAQPIQRDSSMTATPGAAASGSDGSSATMSRFNSRASAAIVASPPGGQRLISASPAAMASAYGRQPG